MDYEAWSKKGKPGCSDVKYECAALRMREGMQSVTGTNSTLVANLTRLLDPFVPATAGADAVEEDDEKVWEAYNCEEKLFFVCY